MSALEVLVTVSAVALVTAMWLASSFGPSTAARISLGATTLLGAVFFSLMRR